jgi:RNA polymerase sigma-70 factor (ECF subfamily)
MLQPAGFPETRASLLAKLGDNSLGQSAWRQFFDCYAPAVYRVARVRGFLGPDADDVVQQVMMSMVAHLGDFKYDRDRGRFRNWVRTVAENKIREVKRRKKLPQVDIDPNNEPTTDTIWEEQWRLQDLLWCLDQVGQEISPKRLAIFKMYSIDGVSPTEVAKQMNTSVGYVYVTRHLVLNLIRKKAKALDEPSN